ASGNRTNERPATRLATPMTSAATPRPLRTRGDPAATGWVEYVGSLTPMTGSLTAGPRTQTRPSSHHRWPTSNYRPAGRKRSLQRTVLAGIQLVVRRAEARQIFACRNEKNQVRRQ